MRIAITGVCGFIGSHLAKALKGAGHEVHGTDNVNMPDHLQGKLDSFVLEDVENWAWMRDEPLDYVYHFAALNDVAKCDLLPELAVISNVMGTLQVLTVAQDNDARVVFPTTHAACDERSTGMYATTKRCGELLCKAWRARGVPVHIVRYTNVYGIGQRANAVIPRMIASAVRGEVIQLWNDDDKNTRDFVHVDDVTAYNLSLVDDWPSDTEPVDVGTNYPVSIAKLAAMIRAMVHGCPETLVTKRPHDVPPPSRAAQLWYRPLGWEPQVSLQDGLQALVTAELEKERRVKLA